MFKKMTPAKVFLIVLLLYVLFSEDETARRFKQLPELLLNYF
tara:strand:- start:335 stop:460 length:126 start_codon:yes stop_codon:yes gene_type:complete